MRIKYLSKLQIYDIVFLNNSLSNRSKFKFSHSLNPTCLRKYSPNGIDLDLFRE